MSPCISLHAVLSLDSLVPSQMEVASDHHAHALRLLITYGQLRAICPDVLSSRTAEKTAENRKISGR